MTEKLEKEYYKIKEVSEMLDVPQSTLRFWESEFPQMIKPMRSTKNLRYYRPKDIENLRIIKFLIKEKGLKIDAARTYLRSNSNNVSKVTEVINSLNDVRDELNSLLRAMGGRWTKSQGQPAPLNTEFDA